MRRVCTRSNCPPLPVTPPRESNSEGASVPGKLEDALDAEAVLGVAPDAHPSSAYLIELTATPAKHTYGFFNQNVVMEYPHERAVADGVNVDFEVYRIRTKITEQRATIEASEFPVVGIRDRRTRKTRWEAPDAPVT